MVVYFDEARKVSVINTLAGANNDIKHFICYQGREKFGLLFNHYFNSLIRLSFPQLSD